MSKPIVRRIKIFFSTLKLTTFPTSPLRHIALPLLTFALGLCLNRQTRNIISDADIRALSRVSIPVADQYTKAERSFAFIVSTGRSGSQHSSLLLTDPSRLSDHLPRAYITHEEEHLSSRPRFVVSEEYRVLAALPRERFNSSAEKYVREVKIPFYEALMERHQAKRLVYTGHLPFAFGLGPALARALEGRIRFVRIRRDRVTTALSLMALGPENEDPWGTAKHRRWFPTVTDGMVALRLEPDMWRRLNRFQRYLWYVDDFECRWQGLLSEFGERIAWMEESLESLESFDGGRGWERVAHFLGVAIDHGRLGVRDNSIQKKGRDKLNVAEAQIRDWDTEYRQLIGNCTAGREYSWGAG